MTWRSSATATRPTRRPLALAAALAMVFALLPAFSPAHADHGTARSTEEICDPPRRGFTDVGEANFHRFNIECAGGYRISIGYPDGSYRPGLAIDRAQMASFIARLVETAQGEMMEEPEEDQFDDIGDTHPHHRSNINKLADAGVVQGYGDEYRPDQNVTREQMATYIANAIDYAATGEVGGDDQEPPPTENDYFDDDDGRHHEDNINRIAEVDIVEGIDAGLGLYGPILPVSRAAMASFVMRAGDYLDEIEEWPVPAEDGDYLGQAVALRENLNAFEADVFPPDFEEETETLLFFYEHSDTYRVSSQEGGPFTDTDLEGFECALRATLDEEDGHLLGIQYDETQDDHENESASEFDLFTPTDIEHCDIDGNGNGNGNGL